MNFLLGAIVGLLLVYLIAYSDFVLTRKLKERIAAINDAANRGYSHRPLGWPPVALMALLFWAPPVLLIPGELYLEYKIILTLTIWTPVAAVFYWYLRRRTSPRLAGQALPLLLAFAVASGILLGPAFSLLVKLLL